MQFLKVKLALIGLLSCVMVDASQNKAREILEGDKSEKWRAKYVIGNGEITGTIDTPESQELGKIKENLRGVQDKEFEEAIALIKKGCYSLISEVFSCALKFRRFRFIEQLDKWSNEKFKKNIIQVLEIRSLPVWSAAEYASPQDLKWILERASKESVNKGIAGRSSPLHKAAESDGDDVRRVKVLVEYGANTFDRPGYMEETPLEGTIIAGNVKIACYLLKCMKKRGLSIDEESLYEVVCRGADFGDDDDTYLENYEPAECCWEVLRNLGYF